MSASAWRARCCCTASKAYSFLPRRPFRSEALEAELWFLWHGDGSVSDLQFIKRSGIFAFDLEAEGAVEEAGRFKAFGALPNGWTADVLFLRFYFSGKRQ